LTKSDWIVEVFCVVSPYSPLKVNRSFGGTSHFHLQGRRIRQAKNRHEAGSKEKAACYLLHASSLLGALSQKIVVFITTAVESHPRYFSSVILTKQIGSVLHFLCISEIGLFNYRPGHFIYGSYWKARGTR
jgi:hypothetical protein